MATRSRVQVPVLGWTRGGQHHTAIDLARSGTPGGPPVPRSGCMGRLRVPHGQRWARGAPAPSPPACGLGQRQGTCRWCARGRPSSTAAAAFACENPSTQGKLTSGITRDDTALAKFPHMLLSFKKYFLESKNFSIITLFILKRSYLASTGYLLSGTVPCFHCVRAKLHFSLI